MSKYKIDTDGLMRPAYDNKLQLVDHLVSDLNLAVLRCRDRCVAVQAGGAYGLWPLTLARQFETVYTFEPDHENFVCLVQNCRDHANVIAQRAALGQYSSFTPAVVRDESESTNAGAGYIRETDIERPGVPIVSLDEALDLPVCDLLCLDVEGFEYFALLGATKTIEICRPVIMLEAKQLPQMEVHYKVDPETAVRWLIEKHHYTEVARVHRDVVLIP